MQERVLYQYMWLQEKSLTLLHNIVSKTLFKQLDIQQTS